MCAYDGLSDRVSDVRYIVSPRWRIFRREMVSGKVPHGAATIGKRTEKIYAPVNVVEDTERLRRLMDLA